MLATVTWLLTYDLYFTGLWLKLLIRDQKQLFPDQRGETGKDLRYQRRTTDHTQIETNIRRVATEQIFYVLDFWSLQCESRALGTWLWVTASTTKLQGREDPLRSITINAQWVTVPNVVILKSCASQTSNKQLYTQKPPEISWCNIQLRCPLIRACTRLTKNIHNSSLL